MLEVFCVEARPLCMEVCSNVSDVYGYTCTHAALKPLASSGYVVVRCGSQPSAEKTKANFICKVDAFTPTPESTSGWLPVCPQLTRANGNGHLNGIWQESNAIVAIA